MKTSINFKAVKADSETHNFRKKTFDYIRKELTVKNQYWREDKIADRLRKIEAYCKEKSGRKLQSNAMPIREAVVVIKEDTTMKDLFDLSKRLEQELGIKVFQIAIHKDEGHWDKESNEWKPNLHAHLVADWQDLKTGKTLKHQSFHYSRMQDITAECLGIGALDAFRTNTAFKNFAVTTYTYDPLVGATTITPPSGIREIYKYDKNGRLSSVVDVNGNIINDYKYNIKPQIQ